jgi:leucyl-tRNA synthetase
MLANRHAIAWNLKGQNFNSVESDSEMRGIEMRADELKEIDRKWAERWDKDRVFEADPDNRPKVFVTFPFPYMNGPLHLGHAFTSTRVDVYARFKRMQGYNVLFPWAWHITGEPIAGAAERVRRGDEQQIRIFRDIDGVPEEELKKFTDPEYIARYYIRESKRALKELGHSIDWRREFTTTSLHPPFSRFIEWQYITLREKGYVTKGTHPVVWCPHDESPTGDHDRLRGEGVSPTEFILLKFGFGDAYLVAATLRPETIYGVTNMWLNPEASYVKIRVGNERWVVSREAVPKIKEQKDDVSVEEEIPGEKLIGKRCLDPISKREILILPASFVDPDNATGVVMSVPSHAPYDYVALRDLQRAPEQVEKYGITKEELLSIKPISLIKVPNYGEHPAIEICERMSIADQHDARLEEATETIYREEFYKGVLKEITGKYAGKKVNEAKKELIADFIAQGIADKMYELTDEVVCRCGTRCLVKILKDQWFLKYSDEAWKARVREALAGMKIFPEEARSNFENTIEWLEDKACARKAGLGTPLPWDPEWKVETLSDSTVYMTFYTIAKHINEHGIGGDKLSKEVFDYLFYGRGSVEEVAKQSGIAKEVLEEMRREFLYWMPVDLRNSAKELIPNHLTFFIFHHVALFDRELWPRAIGVNGMMSIEGEKMSKSKGNFITLKDALRDYGASVTRCTLLYASEGMRDPDWRAKNARDMASNLLAFLEQAKQIINMESSRTEEKSIDAWLRSRMQRHIKRATESLEEFKTRSAFQAGFFDVYNDVRWYLRRDEPNREVLLEVLRDWVKLIAPYAPALSEEVWSLMGEKGYISLAPWPSYREELVNEEAELGEELIARTLEDIESIVQVTNIKPKKIYLYVAPRWKWRMMEILHQLKPELKNAMQVLMREEELRKHGKEIAKLLPSLVKDPAKIEFRGYVDEARVLEEARQFFERTFDASVVVQRAGEQGIYDPANKSAKAMPLKPAIYLE